MTAHPSSTRRDQRHRLRRGSASLHFREPLWEGGPTSAVVILASAAGLAFEIPARMSLPYGTRITSVTLCVGPCQVSGEIVVRSRKPLDDQLVEVGALFHPASPAGEDTWMTLLAGVAAAAGDGAPG